MNLYRMPAAPEPEDAPPFDYEAEAERNERVGRRMRIAFGAVFAVVFAVHLRDAELAALARPWLPLLFVTAIAASILAVAYRTLDRRH